MKRLSFAKAVAIFSFVALTFSFCKKEIGQRKRPFKATFDTWYRVSPAAPQPLTINNQNYLGIVYFPGSGEGTVSHLGNSINVFNQLAYIQPPAEAIVGSVAAPVALIPTYPVAGDFSAFIPYNTSLAIPETIDGNVVNSVFYNQKGDAIFTSALTGTSRTEFASPNRVNFYGKGLIVGGRGRFAAATGEFDFNGYFNPEDNSDASYNAEGWIDY